MRLPPAILLCALISANAMTDNVYRSRAERATLLELYTSEGCSSCPPADRWYSTLTEHPDLWTAFVPVAFHVDYWNYLGWEDRFANPRFAERQRLYRTLRITSGVYTPGVIAGGEEWKRWRYTPVRVPVVDTRAGVLILNTDSERFDASYSNTHSGLELHVVRLGFGLVSEVRAGENSNKRLVHDFVVLAHGVFTGDEGYWQGELPTPRPDVHPPREAVAAWVSEWMSPVPLQAVGGWLPPE